MTDYLIDPPTPFDSLETWEVFLAEMKTLDQSNLDVRREIREAEAEIVRKRRESDKSDHQ